jgi:hypothetical protein
VNQLAVIDNHANVEAYRASTNAAEICKEIVVATSSEIQGRRYVSVEGWQAIAVAHGCAAASRDVERIEGGVRAIGEVRRMSDGAVIATAEGFVGEDEPTWYGGTMKRWKWGQKRGEKIWYDDELPKRPDYAIRAMAQTRAISRACRSAFAHVVVMMNEGLATTPAEEIPSEGFDNGEVVDVTANEKEPAAREKLDGDHTSKTALRKAVHDLIFEVRNAKTEAELDAIKERGKTTADQALRDWPALVTGDPNIAEDLGLAGEIRKRRAILNEPGGEDESQFSMLVASLKECGTLQAITNWMAANEAIIAELDGAESRMFELAYNLHESAILEVAKAMS